MTRNRVRTMSLLTALTMLLSVVFLPTAAASAGSGTPTVLDISYGSITIGPDAVAGFGETGDPVDTVSADGYRITGASTVHTVTVTGGTHEIILSGVTIDVSANPDTCAFSIQTGAAVTLTLDGVSELASGANRAGLHVPVGASVSISGLVADQLTATGGSRSAGIGGGAAEGAGTVVITGGTVTAVGGAGGAGIGGGSGNTGRRGTDGDFESSGGTGGVGGSGGAVSISGGVVKAVGGSGGAGIGGGMGGTGGVGGAYTSGSNGGMGGTGGAAGTIQISGGLVKLPGVSGTKINGGIGGNGGAGGYKLSGGDGGRGGTGGVGGSVTISGGTVTSTGSGAGIGIGGGTGGTGGKGGAGTAGASSGSGSTGAKGTGGGAPSSVISGGSVHAEVGGTPTTGGSVPVGVYYTVVCLENASGADLNALSLTQGSAFSYGVQDVSLDADGRLYLYLPAYAGDTTAVFTAGGTTYLGYHGTLRDTATFAEPNVLKMDQSPFSFTDHITRNFIFGDDIILDDEVTGGTLPIGTVVYTYSGVDGPSGTVISDSPDMPTNAGMYTLKATLPGGDYYHDQSDTKDYAVLRKSIAGCTVGDISPVTYTGAAVLPSVSVLDGSISMIRDVDFSVSNPQKNIGPATVTITGQGNYQGTLIRDFQIAPKTLSVALTAQPASAKVGSDVVLTATVTGAVDDPAGTVRFRYNTTIASSPVYFLDILHGVRGAQMTWGSVPVGTYTLTADYIPVVNDNYISTSGGRIEAFSITKYDQPDFSFVDGTDYAIYEGSVSRVYGDEEFALQTEGQLSVGTVTYSVISGSDVLTVDPVSGLISLLKSGTAVVRAVSPSDATHNEASASVIIDVAKAEQSGFGFTDNELDKTYGDVPFAVIASGGESTGTVTYEVTEGNDVASVDGGNTVTLLKSGTAVITAVKASDDRYNETSAQMTVHVAKAEQSGFGFTDNELDKTYGDVPFAVIASGGESTGAVTYEVTEGNDVASVDGGNTVTLLKSGSAVITAVKASDDRYNETSAQLTVHVAKAEQSGFGFTDNELDKTYGDVPFAVIASGGESTGAVTYEVTEGTDVAAVDGGNTVTLLKSGSAVITAVKAADDRYHETTACLAIHVDKAATVVLQPPTAAEISVVGTLDSVPLTGGEGSVPGSFSWTDPDDIAVSTGTHEVTFTPEDTMRYAESTCDVTVQVTYLLFHSDAGIRLDLSRARLPEGTTSVTVGVSAEPESSSVFSVLRDLANAEPGMDSEVLALYDLTLTDRNGDPITDFSGTITVSLPLPDEASGDLRVLWYDPVTGALTDMNARREDGRIVFETTHFSYYSVVRMTASPTVEPNPATGGGVSTRQILPTVLAEGILVCGFAVWIMGRKQETERA